VLNKVANKLVTVLLEMCEYVSEGITNNTYLVTFDSAVWVLSWNKWITMFFFITDTKWLLSLNATFIKTVMVMF